MRKYESFPYSFLLLPYSPENSSNDGMLPVPAIPTCSLGHGKSAPQKGLTYICEAFLQGKEHTTGQQAFHHAPHFVPGRYALCFPFFSALKRSSLLSIPSLLLHGWAPAGFLRGFCRLAVSLGIVMEKGKAYQPGESLCQKPLCHPAGIWSKGTGKR